MEKFDRELYGATIGDICGFIYEFKEWKTDKPEEIPLINDACRFSDDTVLTAAIAEAVKTDKNYQSALYRWANRYPDCGYASMFYEWYNSKDPKPYNSYGNGSAMRVSPIGWFFDDEETVLAEARRSAEPTHNHPEGIKGAQAVALAIFLARRGCDKEQLRRVIQEKFAYDLNRTLADTRPTHTFDVTCQGTIPVAIIAFLESRDFVSAIQNTISLGGDVDTLGAITGSIAEAFYKEIPDELKEFARSKLPDDIKEALGIT